MGKKSSEPSMGGMEKATKESIALQKQMYEQGREDLLPWYKTGSAGMGKLSDLLGLSGGSVQGRDDIYNELMPQYTTQQTTGGADGGYLVSPEGVVFNEATEDSFQAGHPLERAQQALSGYKAGDYDWLEGEGFGMLGGRPQTSDVTDYEGLNTAVQDRLGSQGTPEGYGSLLESFGMDKFQEDPGYQFRLDQGNKALERAMSSQGVTLGGGGYGQINPQAATALTDYGQGMASQEYGNAYNRYNADQGNIYNRLMGVAGMGANAASQQVGAGQQYGSNVGNLKTGLAGADYQHQQSEYARGTPFENIMGNLSPAYSMGTGRGNAGQMFQQAQMASMFSDERLKENIKLVGHDMGQKIYEFNYKDGSDTFRGVMAQEVLKTDPEAVIEHSNGFLMVDYDKLGLKMEQVHANSE